MTDEFLIHATDVSMRPYMLTGHIRFPSPPDLFHKETPHYKMCEYETSFLATDSISADQSSISTDHNGRKRD